MSLLTNNRFTMKKISPSLTLVVVLLLLASCGGTSNDQGIVFTNLGFFFQDPELQQQQQQQQCGLVPQGLTGISVPIGEATGEATGNIGRTLANIGVQNNLSGQFLRTRILKLSYFAPGASTQPPSTELPLSVVLGPVVAPGGAAGGQGGAQQGAGGQVDSSLPEGFTGGAGGLPICNQSFPEVQILPAQIRSYLSLNRASFPELPFDLFLTASVVGITSAGDTIETNQESLVIRITPETIVPPTDGSGEEIT